MLWRMFRLCVHIRLCIRDLHDNIYYLIKFTSRHHQCQNRYRYCSFSTHAHPQTVDAILDRLSSVS
jgi:hypothetical protein